MSAALRAPAAGVRQQRPDDEDTGDSFAEVHEDRVDRGQEDDEEDKGDRSGPEE
jgi:hypothetical protein